MYEDYYEPADDWKEEARLEMALAMQEMLEEDAAKAADGDLGEDEDDYEEDEDEDEDEDEEDEDEFPYGFRSRYED